MGDLLEKADSLYKSAVYDLLIKISEIIIVIIKYNPEKFERRFLAESVERLFHLTYKIFQG